MNTLLRTLSVVGLAGLLAATSRFSRPAAGPSEGFSVDNNHSSVIFHTRHLGISEAYGRFDRISDKSSVELADDPTQSRVFLVVEADSVNTNSPDRDKHLRSADFFNSKEFPEIIFESTKITGSAEAMEVSGQLSFHGQTKSVTAKARRVGKGDTAFQDHRAGFVAEFEMNMGDFGVEFVAKNPGAVGPGVHLTVSLECIRR